MATWPGQRVKGLLLLLLLLLLTCVTWWLSKFTTRPSRRTSSPAKCPSALIVISPRNCHSYLSLSLLLTLSLCLSVSLLPCLCGQRVLYFHFGNNYLFNVKLYALYELYECTHDLVAATNFVLSVCVFVLVCVCVCVLVICQCVLASPSADC